MLIKIETYGEVIKAIREDNLYHEDCRSDYSGKKQFDTGDLNSIYDSFCEREYYTQYRGFFLGQHKSTKERSILYSDECGTYTLVDGTISTEYACIKPLNLEEL